MRFDEFKRGILGIIRKSGEKDVKVNFKTNDKGVYLAYCSNGVRFSANPNSSQLMVKWGSGHKAVASL